MLGFINVNKPSGMTSSDVVVKLRRKFHIDRIGHMGTLDPMASGVLPIAVGKATRMFDYFLDKYKTYVAEFKFGYETDTLDSEGVETSTCSKIPSEGELITAINSFVGEYDQIPPKFSAKSVNGVKAYKLARSGAEVELKAKRVDIKRLSLLSYCDGVCKLEIVCSSGTYIRALGRDIAYKMNTLATMISLTRTQSGVFDIDRAVSLDELLNVATIESYLYGIIDVFPKMQVVCLSDKDTFRIRNGIKIDNVYGVDRCCFITNNDELICVAENVDNKLKIKTYLVE